MLQQDSQNRLNNGLVYNRRLSRRSFVHRLRFSQTNAIDYKNLFTSIAWAVAGGLAFYSAMHFGVLALFTGYNWLGISFVASSPANYVANGGVILCSWVGATIFSSLSAFCFKHISK